MARPTTLADVPEDALAGPESRDWAGMVVALIESAPVAMYQTDAAGNLTYVNPEYRRVFGLDPEQSADDWAQGVHPEDRARTEQARADFRANPRPINFDYRTVQRTGEVRFFTERVVPIEGKPAFVGTISDVSAHKALLETLLANLPLALIACDAEGRVTHYNREAAELCSMDQSEYQQDGYSVRAGIYQADGVTPVERADRPLARTLRGELVENLELVIIPNGGTERVTVSNGRRLIGPDGRLLGALCVSQDITERRRSELELERIHEQLRSSARQAGMAEVATSILHNVGNVLTSINVCSALLTEELRHSKSKDVGRLAGLIKEQGAQLGHFLTDDARGKLVPDYLQTLGERLIQENQTALAHMATLRKGLEHVNHAVATQQNYAKLTSVHETVSVVDLIEDSLRLCAGEFTRHGIELSREFEPTPPITVDKHKVLQILVNLLRNAKYACDESGKKGRTVRLRVVGDGERVRISVIDNGVGIAPEIMHRLFTHGFTTRAAGHGFGLHSAVLAAQQLGGALRAESAGVGQGATFILELPRNSPRADA